MKKVLLLTGLVLTLVSCGESTDELLDRTVGVSAETACAQFASPEFQPTQTEQQRILEEYGFDSETEVQEAVLILTEQDVVTMEELTDLMVERMQSLCP